jgi:predicted negative regulator of RcsB-dependent stress response
MLDQTEQEQLDALKAWWKRFGDAITWGLTVVLLVFAGWQGWHYYQVRQANQAAMLDMALHEADTAHDLKKTRDIAGQLMDKYASTAYASRAALLVAHANAAANDDKSAEAQLRWAIDHAKESGIRDVARLDLAAVLLDEKRYQDALNALQPAPAPAFAHLYDNLRGDILLASGKPDDARKAWQDALKKSDNNNFKHVVQVKLDALG